MLLNIKDKFMNYLFGLILGCATIFAISKFNNFMDNYELIILIGSAILDVFWPGQSYGFQLILFKIFWALRMNSSGGIQFILPGSFILTLIHI